MSTSPHPPCFHCGSPVDAAAPALTVLGASRTFCCGGCRAVCEAIVSSGNEDYYRYRTGLAPTLDDTVSQAARQVQFQHYDHPEIQREFVTVTQHWREAELSLAEIRCPACLWLNERRLRNLDGILDVQMDYPGQRVVIRWDPTRLRLSEILTALSAIGYHAQPFDPTHRRLLEAAVQQSSLQRILFATVLGMAVMHFALASYAFGAPDAAGVYPLWVIAGRWTSLGLTLALLLYPGQTFFIAAWRELKTGRLGMDTPIAVGLLVAWVGSAWATVAQQGEVYFDSIAMLIQFLLIARYIEVRVRTQAAHHLDRVTAVRPRVARRVEGATEHWVPTVEIRAGDKVRVLPGEATPVDGILCEGVSTFDESLLTGESRPVHHHIGERIPGGALNGEQPVLIEAVGDNTASALGEIHRLVQRGLSSKPYYVELAERAASVLVVGILLVASLTFAFWVGQSPQLALQQVIAVLIITCPCALALAAPVATTLGAAGLVRLHVLPLRMAALETVTQARTFVFDKTGTLTRNQPTLHRIEVWGDETAEFYRDVASALERLSEHPYAKALRRADAPGFHAEALTNAPGAGVSGCVQGIAWRLGKLEFALADAADRAAIGPRLAAYQQAGFTVVALASAQGLQALFLLHDPLRPAAGAFIAFLQQHYRARVVILSGDHPTVVARLAAELGVDEALGGLSPQAKIDWLQRAQQQGETVVMFGDGLNDAPTLAAADASFAFTDATPLAQKNSDFVVTAQGFETLAQALALMQRTRRIVRQNLVWAGLYNLVAVPFAALGYVSPWAAAIGMSLSSLGVVINARRLRLRAPDTARVGVVHSNTLEHEKIRAQ